MFKTFLKPLLRRPTTSFNIWRCATLTIGRERDTIYAPCSGHGASAISVIRISGNNATKVIEYMCNKKNIKPRYATLTKLYHPKTKELLDQSLLLYFPEPNSYTGEDTIELYVHGGNAVVSDVLNALSTISNFRPAIQGEFTKRAFLNGKMNLVKVEALSDLINADTYEQKKQALNHLVNDEWSKLINDWKKEIIDSLAFVTAYIDFGDDEHIEEDVYQQVIPRIEKVLNSIKNYLNDERRGEKIREGIQVSIIGEPNVGKSSLLNVLAKKEVAIVSDIAGTTRDVVQVKLNLNGYSVTISDTAGICETNDPIEKEGIKRAKQKALESDLILYISVDNDDINQKISFLKSKKCLNIINKIDLKTNLKQKSDIIYISCKTKQGIDKLLEKITENVKEILQNKNSSLITRERHRHCLEQCVNLLKKYLQTKNSVDIASEYLREAAWWLGCITGEHVDVEDVLDVLFKEFCIGK